MDQDQRWRLFVHADTLGGLAVMRRLRSAERPPTTLALKRSLRFMAASPLSPLFRGEPLGASVRPATERTSGDPYPRSHRSEVS